MYKIKIKNVPGAQDWTRKQFIAKETEVYFIFRKYAVLSMEYFAQLQLNAGKGVKGAFWTNRTLRAAESFYAVQFTTGRYIGMDMGHNMTYSPSLEYDHGGEFAALPTMMNELTPLIMKELKALYGDKS